jgi:hypothetical protein
VGLMGYGTILRFRLYTYTEARLPPAMEDRVEAFLAARGIRLDEPPITH